jgi:hypothetical protein
MVILLVMLWAIGGCASTPRASVHRAGGTVRRRLLRPAIHAVDAADLFTLSPEMRAYLHSAGFSTLLRSMGKERGLLEALYSKGKLKLDYDGSYTRNAAETFRDRLGNCMSLVIMTAAFAKELDMTVRYQSVDMESWSRSGDFYLLSGHVNIMLGSRTNMSDVLPEQVLVVDFLPRLRPTRARRAPAERGPDRLDVPEQPRRRGPRAGPLDDAYWWARAAVNRNPASAVP